MSDYLYLDYAATAPLSQVITQNYFNSIELYGNPASYHKAGEKAYQILMQSKSNILNSLSHNADWDIFFTSGATESINTVIQAIKPSLLITTAVEHKATYAAISKYLDKKTVVHKISPLGIYNSINTEGGIKFSIGKLPKKIKAGPILVSLIAVNNETGDIIPAEKYKVIKNILTKQYPNNKVYLHLDYTQGFCKIPNYDLSEVDCYSFSGHKIGFYKSFGGVIYKKVISDVFNTCPLIVGGNQQNGLRSGTENPQFVFLLSKVIESHTKNIEKNYFKAKVLADCFINLIQTTAKQNNITLSINTINRREASPYIINFSMLGIEGESLSSMLGDNVAISTGSACNSSDLIGSSVIKEYYVKHEQSDMLANCAVRISFDHTLEIDQIFEIFKPNFENAVKLLARAAAIN